jgi:hypothetical protein
MAIARNVTGTSAVSLSTGRNLMTRPLTFPTVLVLVLAAAPAMAQEAPAMEDPGDAAAAPAEAQEIAVGRAYLEDAAAEEPPVVVAEAPAGARFDRDLLFAPGPAGPPLDDWRMVGELAVGTATGASFALAGATLGGWIGSSIGNNDCGDAEGLFCSDGAKGGALLGAAAVYPLGWGLGVALIGTAGDQTGSVGAAIRGAYIGGLAGAGVSMLSGALVDTEAALGFGLIGLIAGAPIGALIGFNSTRAYDETPSTGLVNVSGKQLRWSVPAVAVTADPAHAQRTMTSVRLLDARF